MTVLADVFLASVLVAGTAAVLSFIAWLAIRWTATIHYLFRKGDSDEDRDRY